MIGSDGGLLAAPVTADRVQLSPGERVEIVVEVGPGAPVSLRSFPLENQAGLRHEEAARFGADDTFHVLELRPADEPRASANLPTVLATLPPVAPAPAAVQRSFDLQWFMIDEHRMDA